MSTAGTSGLGPFCAIHTAPAAFRLPDPATSCPSGRNWADNCSAIFTCVCRNDGFASSISATAPDTTPVDMLTPLIWMYRAPPSPVSVGRPPGVVSIVLPGTSAANTLFPGATRSGFITLSNAVGPRELYVVTTSSLRSTLPLVFSAPTVMTSGRLPGTAMPPYTCTSSPSMLTLPLLPADAMTMSPASMSR